jgi:hypothetical protein
MVLPTVCSLPDLSDLSAKPLIPSALAAAIAGDPEATRTEAMYRRNLARLVDKSVAEYGRLRSLIVAQASELHAPPIGGPSLYVFSIANAAEDCALSTRRALRLFESLKAGPLAARIDRSARRKLEANSRDVGDLRDTLEHIDEAIRTGEVGSNGPIMAACVEPFDRIQAGPHILRFDDLARSLRMLREITDALLNARAT